MGKRHVAQFLRRHGVSFFTDVVRGTGKLKAEVETVLWELVATGLLTADGFDNLRALIDPKRRAGQGSARSARPRHSAGRWSLLYAGEAVERTRALEATCWMLLRRYAVVFRDVLARETLLPTWRELLITLRRLEDRGEVRGGRFVSGFLGEQFALPVAAESLRAQRNLAASGENVSVSAANPTWRASWCRASAWQPIWLLFAMALPGRRRKGQESSRWPRHTEILFVRAHYRHTSLISAKLTVPTLRERLCLYLGSGRTSGGLGVYSGHRRPT